MSVWAKSDVARQQRVDFDRLRNDRIAKAHQMLNKYGIGAATVTIHGVGPGSFHDPPHVYDTGLTLESGMTIAYTSGVRFEDDFVINPDGAELINKALPWGL